MVIVGFGRVFVCLVRLTVGIQLREYHVFISHGVELKKGHAVLYKWKPLNANALNELDETVVIMRVPLKCNPTLQVADFGIRHMGNTRLFLG